MILSARVSAWIGYRDMTLRLAIFSLFLLLLAACEQQESVFSTADKGGAMEGITYDDRLVVIPVRLAAEPLSSTEAAHFR